jgi:hypothetical protein
MKRILLLLTAVMLCGSLTMSGQARKAAKRPAAKARTTAAAKAKAVTPATPASDLPLFCLKGKVKKLTEKELGWVITDFVYDQYGNINEKASKKTLQTYSTNIYYFTEDGFLSDYEFLYEEASPQREKTRDAKGRLTKAQYNDNLEGEDYVAVMTLNRNPAGQITSYKIVDKASPSDIIQSATLTLRPDGKISKSKDQCIYEDSNTTYTYDANGFLTKETGRSPLVPTPSVTTYKYDSQRDAQGNWLKRTGPEGGITEREIEYYE